MGILQTAGIVSGFGAGLSEGLKRMQTGITYWGLQQADREFQAEKLKEQLAHAERLHAQTEEGATGRLGMQLDAQRAEGALTREHAESMKGQEIASHEAMSTLQRESQERIASEGRQSQESIASEARTSQERIASAHDRVTEAIHSADRLLKKQEIESANDISTRSTAMKGVTETGNEILRIGSIMKDPMLDRNSGEYKTLVERMRRLERQYNAYTRAVGLAKDEPAPQRPPFKNQLAPNGDSTRSSRSTTRCTIPTRATSRARASS